MAQEVAEASARGDHAHSSCLAHAHAVTDAVSIDDPRGAIAGGGEIAAGQGAQAPLACLPPPVGFVAGTGNGAVRRNSEVPRLGMAAAPGAAHRVVGLSFAGIQTYFAQTAGLPAAAAGVHGCQWLAAISEHQSTRGFGGAGSRRTDSGRERRNWQWVVSQKSYPTCRPPATRKDRATTACAFSASRGAEAGISAATMEATAVSRSMETTASSTPLCAVNVSRPR